jgi:CRISPR-associated protein Cmr5
VEQKRAAQAWDCVSQAKARGEAHAGKYGGWVKRLPALILTNGLGQTLAFLRAKGKNDPQSPAQAVYDHVSDWVVNQVGPGTGTLLEWILRQDSTAYRRATTEALAFVSWLKRFAEAELKIEEVKE